MNGFHVRHGLHLLLPVVLGLSACALNAPHPRPPSSGHLGTEQVQAGEPGIPAPVRQTPILPAPKPAPPEETYTVVVDGVPVRELLFALARDAKRNVDISPKVSGEVTLNAVDQTLPQILDRISRQVDLRYEVRDDTIEIGPDTPYLQTYKVDYVNLRRDTRGSVSVATQVSTTGTGNVTGGTSGTGGSSSSGTGGDNNSTTTVTSVSDQHFWDTLTTSVQAILAGARGQDASPASVKDDVIANPESGLLMVRATQRQQEKIRSYLDQVMASVRRQVLVEATIVEVTLSDAYQAGIDFSKLFGGGGVLSQSLLSSTLSAPPAAPFFTFSLANAPAGNPNRNIFLTLQLLKQFGDVRVLSSPKVMALNNQTAVFKVVDNRVFFTVESTTTLVPNAGSTDNVTTTPHTVPVGIVMTVTPQIGEDGEVTLNVRPTITREIGTGVQDPNPRLTIDSRVPEVAVREMESVLRLHSGEIAVLGGLMQDSVNRNTNGVPVLSDIGGGIGNLFKGQNDSYRKTELVIFLRSTVIRNPSVQADLRNFRPFLPENLPEAEPLSNLPGGTSSGGDPAGGSSQ